jgi:hypothetical protein
MKQGKAKVKKSPVFRVEGVKYLYFLDPDEILMLHLDQEIDFIGI